MYVCSVQNKTSFQIYGLQKGNELTFYEKGVIISVPNFVMNNHCGLQYPHLPAIVKKQDDKMSYYFIENLVVCMGQRVIENQWNAVTVAESNKKRFMLPQEHKRTVLEFMNSTLGSDNKYLNAFQISMSRNMMQQARIAIPPMISYDCQSMSPSFNSGSDPILTWDVKPHTRFVRSVKLTNWAFMVLNKCVTKEESSSFIDYLKQMAKIHQLRIENEPVLLFCNSKDEMHWKTHLKDLSNATQIIIVIGRKESVSAAEMLTKVEVTTGIATHLFGKEDVLQIANGKGGTHLTLPLQIINAKCGGLNFDVNVPKGISSGLKEKDRLICKNLRRMYIAISACNDENKKAKAMGLTYTVESITEPKSMIWYQSSEKKSIQELSIKVGDAIREYNRTNRYRPTEVVIYRKLVKNESVDLKAEFEQIKEGILRSCPGYRPSIIMLSVKCEDNPQFMKTKIIDISSANRQNVSPGLVLDCCKNGKTSFYLVSNKAEKGTVSSVKFSIVGTRPGYTPMLTIDELKWVTNALAYANQFSNSPGCVPFIVTAASSVAARALLAMQFSLKENDVVDTGSSKRKLDDSNEYYRQMTRRLKDKIEGRHW